MYEWGLRLWENDGDVEILFQLQKTFDIPVVWRERHSKAQRARGGGILSPLIPLVTKHVYPMAILTTDDPVAMDKIKDFVARGTGDRFMAHWRARENEPNGEYRFNLAGALMMGKGARINEYVLSVSRLWFSPIVLYVGATTLDDADIGIPAFKSDLAHLGDLVPRVHCAPRWGSPTPGFRGPGKAEFLVAMDKYRPGTPKGHIKPIMVSAILTARRMEIRRDHERRLERISRRLQPCHRESK
ncbi:Uu.00g041830.m01.CDS01 [Anthostomella pinea]|uniref:Uu.00g041830.m01.CDS01 n=1 Tax=Anthostomella pinea TaxID=933095 RepID=A0AAI8YE19_9PEZI|nr:Uu.00g041830.m01.CDS01 [Anthostomella pinea]